MSASQAADSFQSQAPSETKPTAVIEGLYSVSAAGPTVKLFRARELCESRGGRPGLPVPNKPDGFCGRQATLKRKLVQPCLYFLFCFC